jgi:hypothetical protein
VQFLLSSGCYSLTGDLLSIPWLPYKFPSLRAYILGPGLIQIEDTVYDLPTRSVKHGIPVPENPEFVVPVKENSEKAARAAMEAHYRTVFN